MITIDLYNAVEGSTLAFHCVRISRSEHPGRAVHSPRQIHNERGKHDELESYMVNGEFTATQFYADIEGSPSDNNVSLAMEEHEYFTTYIMILGTYLAKPRVC